METGGKKKDSENKIGKVGNENFRSLQENKNLNPGVLKKKEKKDLNIKIRNLIDKLDKNLTPEQIKFLINKSLDKNINNLSYKELEKKLEQEINKLNLETKNNKEVNKEKIKRNILSLKKILEEELNQDNLDKIVEELNKINDLEIDKLKSYLTSKIKILDSIINNLEKSELGENLFKDIAGVTLGLVDSGYMVGKLIKDFIVDLFVLIKNPIREFKNFKK